MQHDQVYLTAGQVRARYGVSDMSLWRWLRDESLGFPAPMKINRYRYWSKAALEAWESARGGEPIGAPNVAA